MTTSKDKTNRIDFGVKLVISIFQMLVNLFYVEYVQLGKGTFSWVVLSAG